MIRINDLSIGSINRAFSKFWGKFCCLEKRVDTIEETLETESTLSQVGNKLYLFYNFS
jgi:hypothetical protein